jgi:2-phosphoglycerate kinase
LYSPQRPSESPIHPSEDTKDPEQRTQGKLQKKNYSQYDQVKIKVSIEDHFYVFSRFLLSRILTLIKVNEKDAIKVTLDIKKELVEQARTELTQTELEAVLFRKMGDSLYDQHFVNRYKLVTKFYQMRKPFLILVCGTKCMGKSTLVTQLAERINISNILQTGVVKQVIKSIQPSQAPEDGVVERYQHECQVVRNGCNFDISKCFKDGKPLIIDGTHVDPKQLLSRNEHGEYRIKTELDPAANQAVQDMQKKMITIEQDSDTLIVPFLVTIDAAQQKMCIENRLSMLFKTTKKELPTDLEAMLEVKVKKYQQIQEYLISESQQLGFKQLQMDLSNTEETLNTIHTAILKHIETKFQYVLV